MRYISYNKQGRNDHIKLPVILRQGERGGAEMGWGYFNVPQYVGLDLASTTNHPNPNKKGKKISEISGIARKIFKILATPKA